MVNHVIVGAGLAGLRAAQSMRSAGFDGRIVLIGDERHLPYDRPPLSKELLKGTVTPAQVSLTSWEDLAAQGIELLTGRRVVALRPGDAAVELDGGELVPADKVLLSTGSRVRPFEVAGDGSGGVRHLRTVDDALAIRAGFGAGVPVVVVGAGFIGCEVAACAVEAGCAVTMLEAGDGPFRKAVGEAVSDVYARLHRHQGVDLRTGVSVVSVERRGDGLRVVTDRSSFEASMVVAGVGVHPATELASSAGISVGDGIVVDEHGETSSRGVFAAGDVASHPSVLMGARLRVEHWQNAQNQGAAAGRAMVADAPPFGEVPWFWSDQYGHNLQVAGRPRPTDTVVVRGEPESMSFSAWYLRQGMVRATVGVNRPRDVRTGMRIMAGDACPDPATIADESIELKELLNA